MSGNGTDDPTLVTLGKVVSRVFRSKSPGAASHHDPPFCVRPLTNKRLNRHDKPLSDPGPDVRDSGFLSEKAAHCGYEP
jgi:hypothetical protein